MMMMMYHIRLGWGKAVAVLGLLVTLLQIFHMVLLNQLETKNLSVKPSSSTETLKRVSKIFPTIQDSFTSQTVMDTSGEYWIVHDVFKSSSKPVSQEDKEVHRKYGITLASHCSINHLHHLLHLSQEWQGPISIAIFVPTAYSPAIIKTLVVLYLCMPHVTQNVSIHVVYPLTRSRRIEAIMPVISLDSDPCQDFSKTVNNALMENVNIPMQNYVFDQKYPNNLLRNVARVRVQSDFVMVVDVDTVPSPNLYYDFIEFARQSSFMSETGSLDAKTVYIIPSFEIQAGIHIPKDKKSLLQLWTQGYVRPFYFELCWKCQRFTDYAAWRNLTSSNTLSVAYEVPWRDPWEPFYVAPARDLPLYDERFKQYGFNRISQVCELHIASYRFAVLNSAFLVHLGFKTQESFHHSKELEQEQNRLLFRKFKEELKTKYKDNERRC